MTTLLFDILGGWVRAGLIALTAYLVQNHIVTSVQGDRLTMELFTHIMLALPGILALAWTTWQKYSAHLKLTAATNAVAAIQAVQKAATTQGAGV